MKIGHVMPQFVFMLVVNVCCVYLLIIYMIRHIPQKINLSIVSVVGVFCKIICFVDDHCSRVCFYHIFCRILKRYHYIVKVIVVVNLISEISLYFVEFFEIPTILLPLVTLFKRLHILSNEKY